MNVKKKNANKSIKAWLKDLPEPFNHLALESNEANDKDDLTPCASRALSGAFTWSRSEMGHDFWHGVYLLLQDEEDESVF